MDAEREREQGEPGGRPTSPSDPARTYAELAPRGLEAIAREEVPSRRGERPASPTASELEILAALWSYGFLFANQIWRRWWPGHTERWVYQALKRMTQARWVDRYRLVLAEGGTQQRFYGLSQKGFELVRGRRIRGREGVARDARWRGLVIDSGRGRLPRELHVNGWVLAFEQVAGGLMTGWRGPFESRLMPPRRKTREGWVALQPADIVLGTSHRLIGYQSHALEPVNPHATIELQLPDRTRVELMVEYDQGEDLYETEERLRRYDLFFSGWAHILERYRPPARPPILVFACPDETTMTRVLEIADRALTTKIAKAGTPEWDWAFGGRQSILFVRERDIHQRSLQAVAVPAHSRELRAKAQQNDRSREGPRHVEIIDAQLIPAAPIKSLRHE